MKRIVMLPGLLLLLMACGPGSEKPASSDPPKSMVADKEAYDAKRGVGKFTEVAVDPTLNRVMADAGKKSYEIKCASCHKLSDERVVGPGWAGVTQRRTPVWLMNFMTNVDEMIDKDPEVQAMLEICLVRMPNQNIGDEEARNLLEYMRENDGVR